MGLQLQFSSADIAFLERYLPHVAVILERKLSGLSTIIADREELENLQKALSEVLMAYGFDENYDANAVGRQAEDLMDSIQIVLKS